MIIADISRAVGPGISESRDDHGKDFRTASAEISETPLQPGRHLRAVLGEISASINDLADISVQSWQISEAPLQQGRHPEQSWQKSPRVLTIMADVINLPSWASPRDATIMRSLRGSHDVP